MINENPVPITPACIAECNMVKVALRLDERVKESDSIPVAVLRDGGRAIVIRIPTHRIVLPRSHVDGGVYSTLCHEGSTDIEIAI